MVSESSFFDRFDIQRGFRVCPTPSDCFVGQAGRLDAVGDKSIVAVIDDCFAVVEQRQLF